VESIRTKEVEDEPVEEYDPETEFALPRPSL
jgi:hypothetical protein